MPLVTIKKRCTHARYRTDVYKKDEIISIIPLGHERGIRTTIEGAKQIIKELQDVLNEYESPELLTQ